MLEDALYGILKLNVPKTKHKKLEALVHNVYMQEKQILFLLGIAKRMKCFTSFADVAVFAGVVMDGVADSGALSRRL